jgi:septal ring factor EnvC (AmiA/AmiB activator)
MMIKSTHFWSIKYGKKNIVLILLFCSILAGSIYYFNRDRIREGITNPQFDRLKEVLTPSEEQQVLNQLKQEESTINNTLRDLSQKIKNDTASYNATVKALNAARQKVADQAVICAPQFASQFTQIQSIGISDPIYNLLITDTGLSNMSVIDYLNILIEDEVNIVG